MSYKITKSEIKKIGTIKLPKGVWLRKVIAGIDVTINSDIKSYINRGSIFKSICNCLSNYCPIAHVTDNFIQLGNVTTSLIKIDYNCHKSDVTNEWTFYEKIEDTVKAEKGSPSEIWAEAAYKFAKGKNTSTIHGCIDDSWLGK